jgi:iron complex outermembrane recepter protein
MLFASSTFRLKPVIFFSHLENTIQAVYGIDPDNSAVYQFRNTGRAIFFGLENELSWNPVEKLETGLLYTLTERKNLSAPEIRFTDVPGHKLDAAVKYMPLSRLRIGWSGTYNSSRISTTDGIYRTGPFFITGISLDYRVFEGAFILMYRSGTCWMQITVMWKGILPLAGNSLWVCATVSAKWLPDHQFPDIL